MQIRVWRSHACNNSGSFRLVARFADSKIAANVATELTAFFKAHAKQFDKEVGSWDPNAEWNWPPAPTKACRDLGIKYGFEWKETPQWGDGGDLKGWEPKAIFDDGGTVVLYHGYCNGFPADVTTYFQKRGATKVEREAYDSPSISALFRLPADAKAAKKIADPLTKIFAQAETTKYLSEWKLNPPWSGKDQCDGYSPTVGYFCDGKTIGFLLPILLKHIDPLKKYLAKSGVKNPSLRLCEDSDALKFQAIAKARCDACGSTLTYVDPRTHDIDAEQLACDKCGGMFELERFVTKHTKDVAKLAKAAKAAANKTRKKPAAKKKIAKKKATPKKAKKKGASKVKKKTRR